MGCEEPRGGNKAMGSRDWNEFEERGAHIEPLGPNFLKISRAFTEHRIDLHFDYAIYALGSHLLSPLNLWHASPVWKHSVQSFGGSTAKSIAWPRGKQRAIEDASPVFVVGGVALGIQFGTDIAAAPPGDVICQHQLYSLNRQASRPCFPTCGHSTVRTTTGHIIYADLILLCTGQCPNTELFQSLNSRTVNTKSYAPCASSPDSLTCHPAHLPAFESTNEEDILAAALAQIALQNESTLVAEEGAEVSEEEDLRTPDPHIFTFGAIPLAEAAARNLLRRVHGKTDEPLERYMPGPPVIKVSLASGLKKDIYQVNSVVGVGKEPQNDLNVAVIWGYLGSPVVEEPEMFW
ncbi:apoptosis-inducing factor B [Favolaschia claudopus]|uniref:Apoptosis-inducing factor B n=1 Tax=Favolaschia claudopus TaxID=2862362 RepID=A0AAW0A973_9AGAR